MVTIKHRVNDSEQSTYLQSKTSIKSKAINELDDDELIEKINKLKQENDNVRRENLLFSRYLIRINTPKIVETYDEYEDENNLILEILDQKKSTDNTRRYSLKRTTTSTKKGTSGWTKVLINLNEHLCAPDIKIIEHERLSIATYEIEQTRLEWERMKANAVLTLDDLNILYRTTESDDIGQESLNRELERRVDEYRAEIGEVEFNSPYFKVPAELVVSRINKRIHSRISVIGVLRVNTTRLHFRIADINAKIRTLDDLGDKMDEIDIALINTRRIDNTETFEKIDRKYKIQKSSQYPLFRRLQEWKKFLNEQENNISDMKYKCELLQNHFERTIIEIDSIKQECQVISKENQTLKNRINDVIKVPNISSYAHIIEQTKVLQHGIDIWTKRVDIAESLLLQLKQQKKPPSILPPLKRVRINQQLSLKPLDEYTRLLHPYALLEH